MFRQDDPVLAQVRRITLGFPSAAEKVSYGRPTFYTKKVFAYYGGSVKVESTWVRHDQSLLVLPDASERAALLADPLVFVPGYLGSYGWLGIDLDGTEPDWDQASELIDSSYRNTATRKLITELDSTL